MDKESGIFLPPADNETSEPKVFDDYLASDDIDNIINNIDTNALTKQQKQKLSIKIKELLSQKIPAIDDLSERCSAILYLANFSQKFNTDTSTLCRERLIYELNTASELINLASGSVEDFDNAIRAAYKLLEFEPDGYHKIEELLQSLESDLYKRD